MWVAEKSCNVPIGLISAGTLLDILLYASGDSGEVRRQRARHSHEIRTNLPNSHEFRTNLVRNSYDFRKFMPKSTVNVARIVFGRRLGVRGPFGAGLSLHHGD